MQDTRTPGTARAGLRIGCAGWGIPRAYADRFPDAVGASTHLARYARQLNAVEINSTFYRPHRRETYERWADSVPDDFRFSVKVPREITHVRRLRDAGEPLERFLMEVGALGPKLGPLLVQLPPSLAFDGASAATFFSLLRERFAGSVVCEPRHPRWFQAAEAETLLGDFRVGRVAADPALPVPEAAYPGGWGGITYYRLHGSPHTYYSAYADDYLASLARRLATSLKATAAAASNPACWCIFDNTALGAANANALDLAGLMESYPTT